MAIAAGLLLATDTAVAACLPYSVVPETDTTGSAAQASTSDPAMEAWLPADNCSPPRDPDDPPSPQPPSQAVVGHIDGVGGTADGGFYVAGWACATTIHASIDVHLYLGGPAGSAAWGASYQANQASEPAIAAVCKNQGTRHRFTLVASATVRQQQAGRAIYVHGISPVGGNNN
ncbi:MAG: hypothetical protein ACREO8_08395, partial [Luteimonas sp.]